MRLGAPLDSRCPDPALLRLDRVELKVYEEETVAEASPTKKPFCFFARRSIFQSRCFFYPSPPLLNRKSAYGWATIGDELGMEKEHSWP